MYRAQGSPADVGTVVRVETGISAQISLGVYRDFNSRMAPDRNEVHDTYFVERNTTRAKADGRYIA